MTKPITQELETYRDSINLPENCRDSTASQSTDTPITVKFPVVNNIQSPLLKNYVAVKVSGIETHAMVDSGADISCARPQV